MRIQPVPKKGEKVDWNERVRYTKAFSPILFDRIEELKKLHPDITYSFNNFPPRLDITAVFTEESNGYLEELRKILKHFCEKFLFRQKTWLIDKGEQQKFIYQLTYTFEIYKEKYHEPYTWKEEDN